MDYNNLKDGSDMMWARYCFLSNRLDRIEKSAFRNTLLVMTILLFITLTQITMAWLLTKSFIKKEVPNVEISLPEGAQAINDV